MAAKRDNLSAILFKIDEIRLEQYPLPPSPKFNEVLLSTLCVGICGSDIHYWKHGTIDRIGTLKDPMILGHETCAEVIEVGPGVEHLKVGDRVCTEPIVPCRMCDVCKQGIYNLCERITCHSTPPTNGTLTQYFIHPGDFTFKIPDHVSSEEGAMIEPMTVAVYACKRAQVSVGKDVLITGSGPIGLFNLMVAKAMGANRVVITDLNEERLKLAKQLGADHIIAVKRDSKENDILDNIRQLLGRLPDISIECSGAPANTRLVLLATKPQGNAVIVGHGPHEITLPIADAAIREVNILGSFRYCNSFPQAVSLVSSGKVNLKAMISHRFNFDQTLDAFNTAFRGEGVKIMIKVRDG